MVELPKRPCLCFLLLLCWSGSPVVVVVMVMGVVGVITGVVVVVTTVVAVMVAGVKLALVVSEQVMAGVVIMAVFVVLMEAGSEEVVLLIEVAVSVDWKSVVLTPSCLYVMVVVSPGPKTVS